MNRCRPGLAAGAALPSHESPPTRAGRSVRIPAAWVDRILLAENLKQYGKMARYCGDAELEADCKELFFELRDAKTATARHQQRAAEFADRARQRLAEADVKSVIGGRPPWWES